MPLNVRPEPLPEGDRLRDLVLGALDTLIGPTTVLARSAPLEGEPALVLDGQGQVVVVTIDAADGARALLSGLKALEGLAAAAPWLVTARTLPELPETAALDLARLLVLAPTAPPGLARLGAPERVAAAEIRAVRVGDEVGLLIAPVAATVAAWGGRALATAPRRNPFRTGLVTLSADEAAFFDRL
jgi:hypothetical protein